MKDGHFKSECLDLEKSKDNKKYFKSKDKKILMSAWEDLDSTSYDKEEEEEANICLMADTTFEEFESGEEDEV